jgi:hypothetical protein
MEKPDTNRFEAVSATVHEPVEHLKIWIDGTIKIHACNPEGGPVEMDAIAASGVSDLLRELSAPGFPDIPYEPGESGYDALMHQVCVEWGFCGCVKEGRPLHVDFLIPPRGPVTADQFVEWVFLADNMNPNVEPERWQPHKQAIKAAFVRYMGAEIVDASLLSWSNAQPDPDPEERSHIHLP